MSGPIFTVTVESVYGLDIEAIWPDGDAPENPTVNDVREAMEAYGSQYEVLLEWGLQDFATVTVSGEGGSVEVWR